MAQIKYELAKLGIMVSWFLAIIAGGILGYNIIFMDGKLFGAFGMGICVLVMIVCICISYLMIQLRNKYRDEAEYDSNGISIAHGNFSGLSNQERAAIEQQKLMQRELLIDSITMKRITKKGSTDPDADMRRMVGLSSVKAELHKMQSRLAFGKQLHRKGRERLQSDTANHMVFYGNPGTGKTSSVKIITGFLYRYGYIKKNEYIEVDGNFFHGTSYGESNKKAQYLLGQAKGRVLFIDEAYALLNSFESQEVIATIVKTMEDERLGMIIIFAGYKKEMDALLHSNSGLQSRIKYYFTFEDYSIDELWQIFQMMAAEKGFAVADGLKDLFFGHMLSEMQKPNYGNARTVRNILDQTIDNHSVNFMDGVIGADQKLILVPKDLPVDEKMIKISSKVIKSSEN